MCTDCQTLQSTKAYRGIVELKPALSLQDTSISSLEICTLHEVAQANVVALEPTTKEYLDLFTHYICHFPNTYYLMNIPLYLNLSLEL